ncbi:MAG TPA: hypothetical protein VHC90_11285 [Bryobacteraceae bacterium]|nr:hypothetical protein [Bryobacteraceae bacterium]
MKKLQLTALVLMATIPTLTRAQYSAQAQSGVNLGAVQLTCTMARRNSFPDPTDLTVHAFNHTGIPIALRFDVQMTAANSASTHYDNQGKSRINAGSYADFSFAPFQDQQSVDEPPVFAASCAIRTIEVCPAMPPVGFPASADYRPFLDGRCTKLEDVGPITFKTSSTGTVNARVTYNGRSPSGVRACDRCEPLETNISLFTDAQFAEWKVKYQGYVEGHSYWDLMNLATQASRPTARAGGESGIFILKDVPFGHYHVLVTAAAPGQPFLAVNAKESGYVQEMDVTGDSDWAFDVKTGQHP